MDHIGIDVHKNASQVCIRTDAMHGPFAKPVSSARIGRRIGARIAAVRFELRWRYAKRSCKRGLGTSV
jgi:hypothetical protein